MLLHRSSRRSPNRSSRRSDIDEELKVRRQLFVLAGLVVAATGLMTFLAGGPREAGAVAPRAVS
jgi:hypothetical protein